MTSHGFLRSSGPPFVCFPMVFLLLLLGCNDLSSATRLAKQVDEGGAEPDACAVVHDQFPSDLGEFCTGNQLEIKQISLANQGTWMGAIDIKSPCAPAANGKLYLEVSGDPRGWVLLETASGYFDFLSLLETYLVDPTVDVFAADFFGAKFIEHIFPNQFGSEMRIKYGCLAATRNALPDIRQVNLRWVVYLSDGGREVRGQFQYECRPVD